MPLSHMRAQLRPWSRLAGCHSQLDRQPWRARRSAGAYAGAMRSMLRQARAGDRPPPAPAASSARLALRRQRRCCAGACLGCVGRPLRLQAVRAELHHDHPAVCGAQRRVLVQAAPGQPAYPGADRPGAGGLPRPSPRRPRPPPGGRVCAGRRRAWLQRGLSAVLPDPSRTAGPRQLVAQLAAAGAAPCAKFWRRHPAWCRSSLFVCGLTRLAAPICAGSLLAACSWCKSTAAVLHCHVLAGCWHPESTGLSFLRTPAGCVHDTDLVPSTQAAFSL